MFIDYALFAYNRMNPITFQYARNAYANAMRYFSTLNCSFAVNAFYFAFVANLNRKFFCATPEHAFFANQFSAWKSYIYACVYF